MAVRGKQFVFERCPHGDMHDYVQSLPPKALTPKFIRELWLACVRPILRFHKILRKADYLQVAHYDIKPKNLLIAKAPADPLDSTSINTDAFEILVTDFDSLTVSKSDDPVILRKGTNAFNSPEQQSMQKYTAYADQHDVWALATLACWLVTRKNPTTTNAAVDWPTCMGISQTDHDCPWPAAELLAIRACGQPQSQRINLSVLAKALGLDEA